MDPNYNQKRGVDIWMIAFFLTLVLLLCAIGFGIWAFASRNDYKNNVDAKIKTAVESAQKELSDKLTADFNEREKEPYVDYVGPSPYGSVAIKYPKTWGAYIEESDNSAKPIDGYFHPKFVPGLQSNSNIAIRVQLTAAKYTNEVKILDALVKQKKIKVTPYRPEKVQSVAGVRVDGEFLTKKTGSMVMLPLRDKTLKIWTETQQHVPDLDKIVLPSLTFVP